MEMNQRVQATMFMISTLIITLVGFACVIALWAASFFGIIYVADSIHTWLWPVEAFNETIYVAVGKTMLILSTVISLGLVTLGFIRLDLVWEFLQDVWDDSYMFIQRRDRTGG